MTMKEKEDASLAATPQRQQLSMLSRLKLSHMGKTLQFYLQLMARHVSIAQKLKFEHICPYCFGQKATQPKRAFLLVQFYKSQ